MNKEGISYFYNDDFGSMSTWIIRDKFKIYNDVGVILKVNDNKYKIYGLEGVLYMNKDSHIEECYKKRVEDFKQLFNAHVNNITNTYVTASGNDKCKIKKTDNIILYGSLPAISTLHADKDGQMIKIIKYKKISEQEEVEEMFEATSPLNI